MIERLKALANKKKGTPKKKSATKVSKAKPKPKGNKKETNNKGVDLSSNGIKELISFTKDFKIYSLSLKEGNKKITVTKDPGFVNGKKDVVTEQSIEANDVISDLDNTGEEIKSTFVGSYHAVKGIKEGSQIKEGDVIASIFSMNIEHEIKAEKDFVVKKILLEANDPVDYGKPLFLVQ